MNRTEWWEVVLIDDENGSIIDEDCLLSTGELQQFLARWNDEQLIMMRASIYFGKVD